MIPQIAACRVLIKGAGDLATGVAVRLHRAGFPVWMTEIPAPLAVRRGAAFAEAVYAGRTVVEGIAAVVLTLPAVRTSFPAVQPGARPIPVVVDAAGALISTLQPDVVVDGIMAKRNLGTTMTDAPTVIGLGPGFTAGVDCHAVVETNRGHNLGRVIRQGSAEPDTGIPGPVPGISPRADRVLRAPAAGRVTGAVAIGTHVEAHATVATVTAPDGSRHPLIAPFAGVLRGIIHPAVEVKPGMKIGDLDPRIEPGHCFTVSDKSLAVGGGVLEAILTRLAHNAGDLSGTLPDGARPPG